MPHHGLTIAKRSRELALLRSMLPEEARAQVTTNLPASRQIDVGSLFQLDPIAGPPTRVAQLIQSSGHESRSLRQLASFTKNLPRILTAPLSRYPPNKRAAFERVRTTFQELYGEISQANIMRATGELKQTMAALVPLLAATQGVKVGALEVFQIPVRPPCAP